MVHEIADTVSIYALSVDRRYFDSIANVYFGFSAIYCGMLTMYLRRSIRYRRLVLRMLVNSVSTAKRLPSSSSQLCRFFSTYVIHAATAILSLELLVAHASQAFSHMLHKTGTWLPRPILRFSSVLLAAGKTCVEALDIRSENYGLFFLLREIVQTFLQTY